MTRRLLATYLTITAVTLLVLVYPLGRTFASRERDRLLRDIERDATVVASLSEDALERSGVPSLGTLLTDYASDPGGRIVIVDRTGRAVADSETPGEVGMSFTNRPEVAAALAGNRAEGTRRSETLGAELVYVAVPVASGGVVHGAVRITYGTGTLHDRVRANWTRLGVLSAVVMVAVAGVGLVLARGVSRPVRRLEAAARQLAAGELGARAPADVGAPELRQLAVTFNETAARLQALVDAQQAFVADASHQLRTPLAALRLQLDNLDAALPADQQDRVAGIRAEVARLGRLADGLLALTRTAAATWSVETVDVGAIVDERGEAWAPVAEDAGVTLVVSAPSGVRARAVPGALEQMVDNLVSNALDVAPDGSRLMISVEPADDAVLVHVVDEGPGLDQESRGRAFDRFWRAPDAEPGGSGLGLPIVRQLARAGGGDVELRPGVGGGLDAVVTLVTGTGTGAATGEHLPGAHLAPSGR